MAAIAGGPSEEPSGSSKCKDWPRRLFVVVIIEVGALQQPIMGTGSEWSVEDDEFRIAPDWLCTSVTFSVDKLQEP